VIWAVLLMQNVPFDAVLLFDLHAAILGWLLSAVQPKKQHPRHNGFAHGTGKNREKVCQIFCHHNVKK
jgi:hypothetical protein